MEGHEVAIHNTGRHGIPFTTLTPAVPNVLVTGRIEDSYVRVVV